MALEPLAAAIEGMAFARWAGGGAYPFINSLHLLGLIMLVGAIGIVDLRLVGGFGALPLAPLVRALTPLAIAGFLILVVTGVALFAADARALAGNAAFRWKLLLILAALLNALAFRHFRRGGPPGLLARVLALMSLGLWLLVGAFGRFIAYV